MSGPIFFNAGDQTFDQSPSGTVPDVSGALLDYYQAMQFNVVTKTTVDFQVQETMAVTNFRGVIQPFTPRQLYIKPEGQRQWRWWDVHSDIALQLNVDDVLVYLGVQFRVMSRYDYSKYGYMRYELVEDYTGAGPTPQ